MALMLTLVPSLSSGSTRGSVAAGILFDEESRGLAARDARVEPEHDGDTHASLSSPVGISPRQVINKEWMGARPPPAHCTVRRS